MSTTTATVLHLSPGSSRFQRLRSAWSIFSSRVSTHSGPAGVDDDGIICIGGLLISTHVFVDRDTQRAYDQEISTNLNQELRQRAPGEIYWDELGVAGLRKAHLRPSIVVKTRKSETKYRIYNHITCIDWIKPILRRLSLELYVIVSMPLQELAGQRTTAESFSQAAYLELPLSATSLCGARIVVPKSRRDGQTQQEISQTSDKAPAPRHSNEPVSETAEDKFCHQCRTRIHHHVWDCPECLFKVCPECHFKVCKERPIVDNPRDELSDTCVVGGTWLFGESFCVQTALHPFSEQVFEAASQRDSPMMPTDDDDGPLSLFRPDELEDSLSGSSEVSPMSSNTIASSSYQEAMGDVDSESQMMENLPQSPIVPVKIQILQKGMGCDWLTFAFYEKPLNCDGGLLYNNIVRSIPIAGIYLEEPEIILPVFICLPTGTIAGKLLPGKVRYHLPHRTFELRAVSLELPLARGCSGAWVTSGGNLCGIVLLGMTADPLVYIMPASSIKKEMEEVSGVSVRLPNEDDFDRYRKAMQGTLPKSPTELHEMPPVERDSAISESRSANVPIRLSQSEVSGRSYGISLRRLLGTFRKSTRSSISSGNQSVSTSAPSLVSSNLFTNADMLSTRPSSIAASSRSQLSSKAVRERHQTGLRPISEWGGSIPEEVEFDFIVVFDGRSHELGRQWIPWNDRTWFTRCEHAAQRLLEEHGHLKSGDNAAIIYKKAGRCRLVRMGQRGQEVEVESRRLENERDWETVIPVMVADFALKNKYVQFYLDLRWEYASLDTPRIKGEPYSQTIQRALHDNMAMNWQKQKFVPRLILRELFTDATIRELIGADDSMGRLGEDRRRFDKDMLIDEIITGGVHLLAPAVYAGADLSCVHQLMLASDDYTREIRESDCPAGVDKLKFERIVDCQSRFKAHVFPSDTDENGTRSVEHRHLEPHVVLPILWDEESRSVGSGSFGEVFKIKVHYDHHHFSSDPDSHFALKQFHARDLTPKYFQDEARALQALAKNPHANVTLHLASWTQNGRFYMLFPFAECGNLKGYLLSHKAPALTKDFILWLLTQMRDLASAVQHIHNFPINTQLTKGEETSSVASSNSAQRHRGRHSHTGIHYDLKPENILLFSESNAKHPIWKVSDLGTTQINEIVDSGRSGTEGSFRVQAILGDPEYGPPDVSLQGWSSRPYDIWSLGCIYLEILVWVFGIGPRELIQFQQDRLEQPEPEGNQSAAFWYRGRQACKLKPRVKEKMEELRDKCRQRGVFEDLFQLTGDMLTIVAKERPNSPTVQNNMSVILRQATHDLVDEDFYLKFIRDRDEIAKPPTVARRASRPSSIVERSVEVSLPTIELDIGIERLPRFSDNYARPVSESAINTSPLLLLPGSPERLAGQWQVPTLFESPRPGGLRVPSIMVQRPTGDIEFIDSYTESVLNDSLPRALSESESADTAHST